MEDMNELEEYHATGGIEILKTSTLPVEFSNAPRFAKKAQNYRTIGGFQSYIPGEDQAQSTWGVNIRPSLWGVVFDGLFKNSLAGDAHKRALRDALHIDQAQMNAADIFVTNENALQAGQSLLRRHGVDLRIMKSGECLEYVKCYFKDSLGTVERPAIKKQLENQGPVILGSNTCYGCTFISGPNQEEVLKLEVVDRHLCVAGRWYDGRGINALSVAARQRPKCGPCGSVTHSGRGPICFGDRTCSTIVVMDEETPVFAARTTHMGKVVIHALLLRDSVGHTIARISGENMELTGASLVW